MSGLAYLKGGADETTEMDMGESVLVGASQTEDTAHHLWLLGLYLAHNETVRGDRATLAVGLLPEDTPGLVLGEGGLKGDADDPESNLVHIADRHRSDGAIQYRCQQSILSLWLLGCDLAHRVLVCGSTPLLEMGLLPESEDRPALEEGGLDALESLVYLRPMSKIWRDILAEQLHAAWLVQADQTRAAPRSQRCNTGSWDILFNSVPHEGGGEDGEGVNNATTDLVDHDGWSPADLRPGDAGMVGQPNGLPVLAGLASTPTSPAEPYAPDSYPDGVPAEIVEVVCAYPWPCQEALTVAWCESRFRPDAVGRLGERGLLQIHPVHMDRIRSLGYTWDDIFQVRLNVEVAYAIWKERGWRPWANCAP